MDRMILIAAFCGLLVHVCVAKNLVGGPIKPPSYDGKTSSHHNYFLFTYFMLFIYLSFIFLSYLLSTYCFTL